jgi:hypothetical protein
MLAYPGLLLIAFLAMVIGGSSRGLPKAVAACATAGLVAVLLGATAGYPAPRGSIATWLGSGRSDTADLLAQAAEDRFPRLEETTFAHLGQNDEQAVAAFLDKEYVLACPTIAQYVYSPELSGVSRCIRERQPQLLLVTPSFKPRTRARAEWNRLVARGSHLLREEYEFALAREAGNGPIEVWTLRDRREGRPPVAASKTWPYPGRCLTRSDRERGRAADRARPERDSVEVRCPVPQEQGEHDASDDQ